MSKDVARILDMAAEDEARRASGVVGMPTKNSKQAHHAVREQLYHGLRDYAFIRPFLGVGANKFELEENLKKISEETTNEMVSSQTCNQNH